MTDSDVVAVVHDPGGAMSTFAERLAALPGVAGGARGCFILALGSTFTSDVPGVSAAGATPALRRLTPRIDAEVLVSGKTVDGSSLPVSPAGIVSPVVITRAALGLMRLPVSIVDCGTFSPPGVSCTTAGVQVARCLSSGAALDLLQVQKLFDCGVAVGEALAASVDFAICSECVPAGTTTAAAVLTALGYDVDGLLSSSLPAANHDLRRRLVSVGLSKARLSPEAVASSPLLAVSAVGDPMQPFVAGVAFAASMKIPILLAGGSQMLAVWALVKALARASGTELSPELLAVITTKWVAYDQNAGSSRLACLVDAPLAAACLDFHLSRHPGLQAYEDGNVKEGVGAGGAIAAAHLVEKIDSRCLLEAIDKTYDDLVLAG